MKVWSCARATWAWATWMWAAWAWLVLVEGRRAALTPPTHLHLASHNGSTRELRDLRTPWRPSFGRDPLEVAGLSEGDILPPPAFAHHKGRAQEKNAVKETTKLWPNAVIFYEFSSEFTFLPLERYIIRRVMDDIASRSCVRFVRRTSQEDYVKIIYDGPRCYSHIGRVGGAQVMSLGAFCVLWWDRGPIYHELLHALGFFHEHNRPDRDKFVEIKWENIADGEVDNFIKRSHSVVDLTDLPYDINSVMHYSPFAFGKWYFLTPTIKSKKRGYNFWRSSEPSKIDYSKLNRLYKCRREGSFLYSQRGFPRSSLWQLEASGVSTSGWTSRSPSTRYTPPQLPASRPKAPITRYQQQVTPARLRHFMHGTLPKYQQNKKQNHYSFPNSLARPSKPPIPVRYSNRVTSTERPERFARPNRPMDSAFQLTSTGTRLGPGIKARWQTIPNRTRSSSTASHPSSAG